MRLTPEREKEIRKEIYENIYFSCPSNYEAAFAKNAIYELLSEIDVHRSQWSISGFNIVTKELERERDSLICEKRGLEAAMEALKAENEKLKASILPWNPESAKEYRKIIADADLVKENQKLKERIAKLREALKKYAELEDWGYDHSCDTDCDYGQKARETLAQDDELENANV